MMGCEHGERERREDGEMDRGEELKVRFCYGGNWYENHFL